MNNAGGLGTRLGNSRSRHTYIYIFYIVQTKWMIYSENISGEKYSMGAMSGENGGYRTLS